jgi:hypothetical protein
VPAATALHWTRSYRYIPGNSAYSAGVAAERGYDIVGLRFAEALSVPDAFLALDRELETRSLESTAVVGFELRSPAPVAPAAFASFNAVYQQLLAERGMLRDGVNPVARTNVAPVRNPPDDVVVSGAFVVRPCATAGGADFVIAGSAEVAGSPEPANIVAFGDVSQGGLAQKADFVLGEMLSRLTAVDAGPDDPNIINVYTVQEIGGLAEMIERQLTAAGTFGYAHLRAAPPVTGLEFEMDCRHLSACELI